MSPAGNQLLPEEMPPCLVTLHPSTTTSVHTRWRLFEGICTVTSFRGGTERLKQRVELVLMDLAFHLWRLRLGSALDFVLIIRGFFTNWHWNQSTFKLQFYNFSTVLAPIAQPDLSFG